MAAVSQPVKRPLTFTDSLSASFEPGRQLAGALLDATTLCNNSLSPTSEEGMFLDWRSRRATCGSGRSNRVVHQRPSEKENAVVHARFQLRRRAATCLLATFLIGLSFELRGAEASDDYPHLRLGNPSQAKVDEGEKDNFLMKKEFFALSYNNTNGTPNWVS